MLTDTASIDVSTSEEATEPEDNVDRLGRAQHLLTESESSITLSAYEVEEADSEGKIPVAQK